MNLKAGDHMAVVQLWLGSRGDLNAHLHVKR
jgi:hypothetical protein